MKQELKQIENANAFSTKAGGVGIFGNPVNPRVLWVGADKTDALAFLYEQVEAAANRAGFTKETRPFRPHITLAKRCDGSPHREQCETAEAQAQTKRRSW